MIKMTFYVEFLLIEKKIKNEDEEEEEFDLQGHQDEKLLDLKEIK